MVTCHYKEVHTFAVVTEKVQIILVLHVKYLHGYTTLQGIRKTVDK